jgi:hypothetical protein
MPLSLSEVPRLQYLVLDRFPELADHNVLSLVRLIQAASDEVERYAGGPTATETFVHNGQLPRVLSVMRPIATIAEIFERWTLADAEVELDASDYRLLDQWRLLRLTTGINPAAAWGQQVVLSYSAVVDQALRDRIICELVQLDVNFRAHERSQEVIGDYSLATTDVDYAERRRELLAQLTEGKAVVF